MKTAVTCCLLGAALALAHPHVFVDATVKVLFEPSGLVGIRNHWVYDELYSAAMMSTEPGKLCTEILEPFRNNNFYNYVQLGSSFLRVSEYKGCKASFKDNRLVLDFDVSVSSALKPDYTMLVVVVADPTNYIQMTADMENADIDAPDNIDVEFFNDGLKGLTLFRAFRSDVEGLFIRFKKK